MKTLHEIGLCFSLVAAAAGCTSAYAEERRDPKKEYAKQASSTDPGAGASARPPEPEAKVVDGHKPWAPAFDVVFPEGASSNAPTREEWEHAAAAWEVRVTEPQCKAQRVREWYRVTCQNAQRIEMISGGREGVSFGFRKTYLDSDFRDESWVVFPARRGDRRAFEVFTWAKWGVAPDSVVTEQLLEGDPAPLVAVHGLHWGF